MFSKAFAVITNVIGQGAGKDLPYEASDESYSCLLGKTIWEAKRAKRKVCFISMKTFLPYGSSIEQWRSRNGLCVRLHRQIRR